MSWSCTAASTATFATCGAVYDADWIMMTTGVPHCTACGGRVKPDVVLYEESLPEDTLTRAVAAIAASDLLIVGGTSLTVYPAAGLLRYFRGSHLVLLNRDATPWTNRQICASGSQSEQFWMRFL